MVARKSRIQGVRAPAGRSKEPVNHVFLCSRRNAVEKVQGGFYSKMIVRHFFKDRNIFFYRHGKSVLKIICIKLSIFEQIKFFQH